MKRQLRTYEIFSGKELEIADLIQRRRLQIMLHSYLYYELDTNLITDKLWSDWAKELEILQRDYPEIEILVPYRDGFEDWDASTGALLPYSNRIVALANKLVGNSPVKKLPKIQKTGGKRSLF